MKRDSATAGNAYIPRVIRAVRIVPTEMRPPIFLSDQKKLEIEKCGGPLAHAHGLLGSPILVNKERRSRIEKDIDHSKEDGDVHMVKGRLCPLRHSLSASSYLPMPMPIPISTFMSIVNSTLFTMDQSSNTPILTLNLIHKGNHSTTVITALVGEWSIEGGDVSESEMGYSCSSLAATLMKGRNVGEWDPRAW
ncbi:unnamed protein product [Sphenostylis stenocarpa]|uniref:Uncharacterized protein n=1 Tax=Sphenostylis stenocarpa TaxID=92480 RepID=A0AA86SLK5_9FABA|nr:unnamed protein product [Sphenostylis stenocarpa]